MIPAEAFLLRDLILAEARARSVALEHHALAPEQDLPVLRLRLGEFIIRSTRVRLPGPPGVPTAPDVITVHGSGHRASKMWPRKRDGNFNIEAVVDHLLALVKAEVSRPEPELRIERGVPASVSGLHVMTIAGTYFEALPPTSKPGDLLERVQPTQVRARIEAHLDGPGLTDGDLRALGDAAGLFFGRATKIDFDPFEPSSDRFLNVFRLGSTGHGRAGSRHVLLLNRRGHEVTVADPAGPGLTTVTVAKLSQAWKRGTMRGGLWLGTIGPR